MLEQDSKKNEMETGAENSNITERVMVEESCRMELSSKYKNNRAIGRPRKGWEDDINEFLKLEDNETENSVESSSQFNKIWINAARRWTPLENKFAMTAEERHEGNVRIRRNTPSRPARYVNGVRLSDEEVANITKHKVKRRSK